MLRVALTHDVDRIDKTFQYLTHISTGARQILSYGLRSGVKNLLNSRAYFMMEEILELEDKLDVRSTFFFLQESLPFKLFRVSNWPLSLGYYKLNDPRLKKIYPQLLAGGWEIGLHGSYASYNNYYLIVNEKELLEDAIESPVFGIRQHFLNLSDQTWEIQAKAGFKYDASWGYNRGIGFKENKWREFHPLKNSDFKVAPLALMDYCVMQIDDYMPKVSEVIEQCIANEGILVINWHQRTFNDFEFPGYRKTYIDIIKLCKEYNASFYTLNDYLVPEELSY